MNKESKRNAGFILGIIITAVVFCILWTGYINSEYSSNGNINPDKIHIAVSVEDGKGMLDDKQKELLKKFGESYAETLCRLEVQDISGLFADAEGEDYYKNITAYGTLVSVRKMSDKNLAVESAEVDYRVETAEQKGAVLHVHVKENNVQKFVYMTEPSYSYNLNHIFVLEEINGEWYIQKHEQEEDFFLLALEAWNDASGTDCKSRAENTVKILTDDARENIDELKINTGNEPVEKEVTGAEYNRDAAVAYAKEWCDERNYNGVWLAYDMYGGNCQNFASQCIYAGGIGMDYKGYPECQWKFYSQEQNNRQTRSGRSYSWTGVDPFYTYAVHNQSDGMICQADMALEYAERGDVIQVGAYHRWRHSLVVTDVMYNDDGSLMDIAVASNTADRWNYPLSAYIYTYPRLIHIIGQK